MEIGVPPTSTTATSATWNSGRLRIISATRSPGPMPSPESAVASLVAASPYGRVCHLLPVVAGPPAQCDLVAVIGDGVPEERGDRLALGRRCDLLVRPAHTIPLLRAGAYS